MGYLCFFLFLVVFVVPALYFTFSSSQDVSQKKIAHITNLSKNEINQRVSSKMETINNGNFQKSETPEWTAIWVKIVNMVAAFNFVFAVIGGIVIFSKIGFVNNYNGDGGTMNPIGVSIAIVMIAEGVIGSAFLFLIADMAENIALMRVGIQKLNLKSCKDKIVGSV
jgi:hypothetical protein